MKKVLTIVLVFAVILAALLGAAGLWEHFRPVSEAAETPAPDDAPVLNEMTPDNATILRLEGDRVSVLGAGASWADGVLTVGYPGTYRLSGSLTGQILVDLTDLGGAVYLILDGADVTCPDGPALYVRQAKLTVLQLSPDTENRFADGAEYVLAENGEEDSGAAIFSEDDLTIRGEGELAVTGWAADGVRSKDGLAVEGGTLTVTSADDGLQGSDYVKITGGTITIGAYGDGVSVTKGFGEIGGGTVAITCAGDGVDAAGDVLIRDGAVSVLTYGGPENYAAAAGAEISARGLKGQNVTVLGGTVDIASADDGIHARADAVIAGGSVTIAAGDDGVSAGGLVELFGGDVAVSQSYEALEGDTVSLFGGTLTAAAENNGIAAGEGGFTAENTALYITAPRGVSSEGELTLRGGELRLDADGTDSLFAFGAAEVGGTVLAAADAGGAEVLLEKGRLPGSLLFVFGDPVAAGTGFVLRGPSGEAVLRLVRERDTGALLLASGALMEGQIYTLTAGEDLLLTAAVGPDCTVTETAPAAPVSGGRGGFPGGGPGGPSR